MKNTIYLWVRMLYLVSTPIGNLQDISFRTLDTLKKVDLILAEDTRRTGMLLKHYLIQKKMMSYNDINKERITSKIIEYLNNGTDIALVSDNGTPCVSDPGFYIVREAIKHHILISHIPGPTAFVSALVCSGLPTDKFSFSGFLPKKEGKKTEIFTNLNDGTNIFYESPHRIIKSLKLLSEIHPNIDVVIARELTKKFEEFIRGKARELYLDLKDKTLKGEIVLLVHK